MSAPLDPRSVRPRDYLASCPAISERALRRWFGAVVGRGDFASTAWQEAGIFPRPLLDTLPPLPRLALEEESVSPTDRFTKLLFRTANGLSIETVIIPLHKPGCATVCLSSQVGCVMGCVFCATGRMTTRRNLETWEIVDQFISARERAAHQGLRITGAVFMGMGEPFLNYQRVIAAAEILSFPSQNAISARAITISTVGLVDEIERYTEEKHPFRLSISLGAPTDEQRRELVPVAARFPVRTVIDAARRYALSRRDRVNIAYVCISGKNVSANDARALGELIGDTPIRLDLIDVFDTSGRYLPPTEEEMGLFRDALRRFLPQPVARRYSGGKDIRAACGTLAGVRSTDTIEEPRHSLKNG